MKNIFLLVLMMFPLVLSAQKLKINEVDKFTNKLIQQTNYETLFRVNLMASGYSHQFRFSLKRSEDNVVMFATILLPEIVKYDESSKVYFLLDNKETVILYSNYTGISGEKYANGYLFETSFSISQEDLQKFKNFKVTDIRIEYMDGYYDKEINDKKQNLIQQMLMLFK